MTVDEYKKRYGKSEPSGFWDVGSLTYLPEIPVTLYDIISQTIRELNKIYIPYVVGWVGQKKSQVWEEIKGIENEINIAVLCEDETSLRSSLESYYDVWMGMCVEFEASGRIYIPF